MTLSGVFLRGTITVTMNSLNSRKAFTLIEVIIVIGITAVLAGLILTYTSASRDQVALYVEEAKLAQTISRAKSLAITTFNRASEGEAVPCAYGVHVNYDEQSYEIFSYSAPKCEVTVQDLTDIGEGDCTNQPACVFSKETLPANVKLTAMSEDAIEDIVFIPPDPKTLIWKQGFETTSNQGSIGLSAGKAAVTIGVGEGGQITF